MPDDYEPLDYDSMGGVGDYLRLQQLYDETEQLIDELREHEYEAAEHESRYRMLVSQKTASERMHGTPVTVIGDLVRGEEPIATEKLQWQKAEADAKSVQHLIFLHKGRMEMMVELMKHEWYRPSNG